MPLETSIIRMLYAKNREYWFRFIQVIED